MYALVVYKCEFVTYLVLLVFVLKLEYDKSLVFKLGQG